MRLPRSHPSHCLHENHRPNQETRTRKLRNPCRMTVTWTLLHQTRHRGWLSREQGNRTWDRRTQNCQTSRPWYIHRYQYTGQRPSCAESLLTSCSMGVEPRLTRGWTRRVGTSSTKELERIVQRSNILIIHVFAASASTLHNFELSPCPILDTMIDDVGSLPRLHSLTRPVRAFKGVNGYRAAATLLPSSCSRLNVELALRWVHVGRQRVMPFQLPVCSLHTESNTSTWIPRELRCFLNAGGGNRPRLPVPTKRISVTVSVV